MTPLPLWLRIFLYVFILMCLYIAAATNEIGEHYIEGFLR